MVIHSLKLNNGEKRARFRDRSITEPPELHSFARTTFESFSEVLGGVMFFRTFFLLIFCVSSLVGCAATGGYPDNPVDVATDLAPLKGYFDSSKIVGYQAMLPTDPGRAPLRNEIIYGRIAAYDIEFTDFQQRLNRERLIPDATADVAVAAMGGVGAAVASAATKTALLAATSAVTGAKGAIDKDVFYSQTMSVLFAEMAANRATVLAAIDKGTALSDASYPLTRGLIDTASYRDAGSIPGAITGISHDAGTKNDKAKTDIQKTQDAKLRLVVR